MIKSERQLCRTIVDALFMNKISRNKFWKKSKSSETFLFQCNRNWKIKRKFPKLRICKVFRSLIILKVLVPVIIKD